MNKGTLFRALMTGCAVVTAPVAMAQTQPQGSSPTASNVDSGDIVVTATRREERLQEVPLAVTALSAAALEAKGINSAGDLGGGRVPGLAASPLFGAETTVIFGIRGQSPNDSSQGTLDLPVAFYIDGLNYARAQGAGLELVTPERIEVLRGPQGQLFGRNAEAGVVQVISQRPTGELGGDFRVTRGNYNLFAAKGRLDLPEVAGFRIQLSGVFRRHDGYIDNQRNPLLHNITPPTDPDSSFHFKNGNYDTDLYRLKTHAYRIAVARDFGNLNVLYAYDQSYGRDDQGFIRHRFSKDVGTIFNPTGRSGPLTFSNLSGPDGTPFVFGQPPLGDNVPGKTPYGIFNPPLVTKTHGHLLNLTYELNDNLTIRSITGSRSVLRHGGNVNSAAVSPFFGSAFEYMDSDTFSQEVQFIYDTEQFNITGGAIYFKEDIVDERTSGLAFNCVGSAVASASCVPGSSQATKNIHSLSGFKRSLSKSRALGLYAQASYTLGAFELIGGLRYTDDQKIGRRVIDRNLGIDIYKGVGTAVRNKYKTHRLDPAATIKYNISDDINAYARYAVGYRAGGSNVRSDVFISFDEEEVESWEVGFKSQFLDRRVTLNAAAFYNTIKGEVVNIQTRLTGPRPNVSITESFNNPVDRKVKGLELELAVRPVEGLTISGNYTYLDTTNPVFGFDPATFKVFAAPGSKFSPATGLVVSPQIVAGHPNARIILYGDLGSPKHSGSINVDYETTVGPGKLALHGDWMRTSRYVIGAPNVANTDINATGTGQTQVPTYGPGISVNRLNARIAYSDIPLHDNVMGEVTFWVKNITNKADAAFAFNNGPIAVFMPTYPRTMGVDFRVKF